LKTPIADQIIAPKHYQHRIMTGIIIAQLIFIAIFRFWPQKSAERTFVEFFDNEDVIVEEMIITRQANAPAAPPKPQIPIPVPNDEFIDEEILFPELENLISFDSLSTAFTTGQTGDEERISGNPDRAPRIVRIVEPTISNEAKNAKVKAMVLVNFTVGSQGQVMEAIIAEIRVYEGGGEQYTVVQDLGYGILPAVIEAAFKWRFRPAEEDGENVGAYIQEVFTIGF
jgi:protein TonB